MKNLLWITYLAIFSLITNSQAHFLTAGNTLTPELQSHGTIVLLIDPETGTIVDANRTAVSFYGYTLEVYSSPIVTSSKKTLLLSIIHDATDKMLAENELLQYKTQLEELVAKRTQEVIDVHTRSKWLMVIGLILVFGLVMILFRRHQQALFFRRQYEFEQERKVMLERFEYLTRYANDIILLTDKYGQIVEANERAVISYGFLRKELLQMNIRDLRDLKKSPPYESIQDKARLENGYIFEAWHIHRNETTFPVETSIRQFQIKEQSFYQHIIRDITSRKQAEEIINASLRQKETLLKEIHHRVKNNMQVISSLLNLQITRIADERVIQALMDCQGRINTMAAVHEMLYMSDSLSVIDCQAYITKLTGDVMRTYHSGLHRIKLKVDAKGVTLGIEQALPLGLIINELLSNALKYGFPEKRHGQITIRLQECNQNIMEFVFSDNGIGIPKDLDWRNTKSLGLNLIVLLAENQLNGTISLDREKENRFTVKFNQHGTIIEE
jgi:PAS domain S-box-containing protein